ncbi:Diacylglycerol acyltransferase domain-containing protein [Rozella allomycis CSF55]|uniref:RNA helicase n=1 Tax=Rozella allomycis (strain CSF55) TaxID=988480 RepID=A0A075B2F6_ROZAC|nr:Diacylglycerol acyltransferase domain-containing protein [Rozella allomycis CSF55]|eukprot:EPZ36547.1 Diacylglycerol acyltransferase domain-containing protein [Rozella allomycis CSF55]
MDDKAMKSLMVENEFMWPLQPPASRKGFHFIVDSKAQLAEEKKFSAKNLTTEKIGKRIEKYSIGKTIGSGSTGKVAIKIIMRDNEIKSMTAREVRIQREVVLMRLMDHPNIVKFHDIVATDDLYFMISEYINGGQMLDFIIAHGKLREKQARRFFRQLLSAISNEGIYLIKRDLKIENILIGSDGQIKLIDFGLANFFDVQYCLKTVLVCGKVPFDDMNATILHEKIKAGQVEYPSYLSSDLKDLLSKIIQTDPLKRIPLNEIIDHPWVTKYFPEPVSNFVPHRLPLDSIDRDIEKELSSSLFFQYDSRYINHILNAALNDWNAYSHNPVVCLYFLMLERNKKQLRRTSSKLLDNSSLALPSQPKPSFSKRFHSFSLSEKNPAVTQDLDSQKPARTSLSDMISNKIRRVTMPSKIQRPLKTPEIQETKKMNPEESKWDSFKGLFKKNHPLTKSTNIEPIQEEKLPPTRMTRSHTAGSTLLNEEIKREDLITGITTPLEETTDSLDQTHQTDQSICIKNVSLKGFFSVSTTTTRPLKDVICRIEEAIKKRVRFILLSSHKDYTSTKLRSMALFNHARDYFPVSINIERAKELDPEKSYMIGYHPHGIIGIGCLVNFMSEANNISSIYPDHNIRVATLNMHFAFPIWSEYFKALGFISANKSSIKNHLTRKCSKGKKYSVVIVVGGASEALVNNRRVTSLVPCLSFGENDVFNQINNGHGTFLRKAQKWLTKIFTFSLPLVYGHGKLMCMPAKTPITTIKLQERYMAELKAVFDEHKEKLGKNLKTPLRFMAHFWKPGTVAPGSLIDRESEKETSESLFYNFFSSQLTIEQQRQRLPIYKHKKEILYVVDKYQVTTQIPQYLYENGWCDDDKVIACTQPRRIAATSVAARVAEECQVSLGETVGYSIRFEDKTSERTRIKYMTDGSLFREAMMDPLLSKYSVIMVDEAHERSLIIKKRPELRILVSSATLDAQLFCDYFTTDGITGTILSVQGRTYPVDVFYLQEKCLDYIECTIETIKKIHQLEGEGDVLCFMTGKDEIDAVISTLKSDEDSYLLLLPIYAGLPVEYQFKVFEPTPKGFRKVIVATNIAEASVTIDNIVYVVDCGYNKIKIFHPETGLDTLVITRVIGRAGRLKPGKAYRLYTMEDYSSMSDNSIPEIQRSNMSSVVLQLKSLGIDNIVKFPFMSPPSSEMLWRSLEFLFSLGAINEHGKLTKPLGEQLAELPVDPMLARTVQLSSEFNVDISVQRFLL